MADLGSSKVFGDLTVTGSIVNPTLEAALGGKAESSHTHPWSQITGAPATATRWPAWTEVTSKPATFTPSAHSHAIADVTGLQTELNGKAATSHTHDYVPTTRTVNGKALSANISLTAADVGAAVSSHTHSYLPLSGGTLTGALTLPNSTPITGTTNGLQIANALNGSVEIGNRNTSYTHYGSSTGNHYFYGNIVAQSNITAYSDIRVKTNMAVISDALSKVRMLTGYTYDRTDIECPRQMGVIAQDVYKVAPEAVSVNPENDHMHVAYGNLVGLLIEAIKELKTELDELKGRVN